MADNDVGLNNLLEIYQRESASAKSTRERNEAFARFQKGAQLIKASDKGADTILEFLSQIPGQEIEGMKKVLELKNRQIEKKQDLQGKKSDIEMELSATPERAKAGIYSLAVSVATIARLFGANDFAQMIEDKVAEWKPKVKLNTDGITDGRELKGSLDKIVQDLKESKTSSDVSKKMTRDVESAPAARPTVVGGVAGGSVASSTQGLSGWESFRAELLNTGLTAEDADKVMPPWKKTAALTGEKGVLDQNELNAFRIKLNATDLTEDKKKVVNIVLNHTMGKGPIEESAAAGPR